MVLLCLWIALLINFLNVLVKWISNWNGQLKKESVIQVPYSVNYRQSNEELYIPAVMTAAKVAMSYKERRLDFVTDYCVLYFIDVFGPNVKGWKKYKDTDLYECLPIDIDKRVINRRSKRFESKYSLEKPRHNI